MKEFKLHDKADNSSDDINQRTISVTEEEVKIKKRKTTLAKLIEEAERLSNNIKKMVGKHDAIITEIDQIETSLAISANNKPKKITDKTEQEFKDEYGSITKWADKVELLEGEYIDHKGTIYVVLQDHTASKETPPPQEDLYELV